MKSPLFREFTMPLYEFQCDACGDQFEELVLSQTEKARPRCPHCGGRNVHKLFSTFAVGGGDRSRASSSPSGCGNCTSGSCAGCRA